MTDFLFLQGMLIGFAIAAPIGPVGVLCIRKALADGRAAAFVAGMGAALADTFYGAVAGFGLSFVSQFITGHQFPLKIAGGLFLLYVGWHTYRTQPDFDNGSNGAKLGLVKDFVSTFVITLTNPATIIAFMAVFASFGAVSGSQSLADTGILVGGVFVGSSLWWLTLSAVASAMRSRFNSNWLVWLDRVVGVLLAGSGVLLLGSLLV